MAHKSKTQRAKASAAKANRKDRAERDEIQQEREALVKVEEEPKKGLFKKKDETTAVEKAPAKTKAVEKKPKKVRFQFLRDVRAEMKRVTWPTRQDVIRWSVVVVGALVFFGVFTAVLDNVIITPLLVALSNLGA